MGLANKKVEEKYVSRSEAMNCNEFALTCKLGNKSNSPVLDFIRFWAKASVTRHK
jgi:hypothetical protein